MESNSSSVTRSKVSNFIKLFFKLAVSAACFWYMSTKIDFSKTWQALLKANWWWLGLAILLYTLSKLLSAFRLNIFLRCIQLHLTEWQNIKLYWLGMFYNLFLPGSIGGDAYKVVLLNKRLKIPYKKASAAILLDRFSGLLGVGIILSIYGIFVLNNKWYDAILAGCSALAILFFYLITRYFFKDFLHGFLPTFTYGLTVQLVQVFCLYTILMSLRLPVNHEWIFIFLLASVVSVFPISMGGGLGTRELVFAEGARFFQLDPELGVTISLLFFLCNLLSCFWGAYFIYHDPLPISDHKQAVIKQE